MIGLTALWLLFCGVLLGVLIGVGWAVAGAAGRVAGWVRGVLRRSRVRRMRVTREELVLSGATPDQMVRMWDLFTAALQADRDPLITRHPDGKITLTERPRGGPPVVTAEILPQPAERFVAWTRGRR